MEEGQKLLHRFTVALGYDLHCAIPSIGDPPGQAEALRCADGVIAEVDPLHASVDYSVQTSLWFWFLFHLSYLSHSPPDTEKVGFPLIEAVQAGLAGLLQGSLVFCLRDRPVERWQFSGLIAGAVLIHNVYVRVA